MFVCFFRSFSFLPRFSRFGLASSACEDRPICCCTALDITRKKGRDRLSYVSQPASFSSSQLDKTSLLPQQLVPLSSSSWLYRLPVLGYFVQQYAVANNNFPAKHTDHNMEDTPSCHPTTRSLISLVDLCFVRVPHTVPFFKAQLIYISLLPAADS